MSLRAVAAIYLLLGVCAQASGQSPAQVIGFVGLGYGIPLETRRYHVAPGAIVNFYFTGAPTEGAAGFNLEDGEWPEELRGYSLEFNTRPEVIRARIGRVTWYSVCPGESSPHRSPACAVLVVTARVPWGVRITGPNSPSNLMTLVTPLGRGEPVRILAEATAIRLLSGAETFGRQDSSEAFHDGQIRVDSPQPNYLRPGDKITVFAWGLGLPERLVEGVTPDGGIPVPRNLVVNFHFIRGLPVVRQRISTLVDYWSMPNQVEARPDYVGLAPGKVGMYEIRMTVPDPPEGITLPEVCHGLSGLTVTIASAAYLSTGEIIRLNDGTDGFSRCLQRAPVESQ